MASSPLKKWGIGGGGGGEGGSDETSRIFCVHVNFPEINGVISVYGGTKSNNHKEGISYQ